MRIAELNLVAFGPFTDRVLAFDEAGLHIVYGPNETVEKLVSGLSFYKPAFQN